MSHVTLKAREKPDIFSSEDIQRPQSRADQIREALRQGILQGSLEPGHPLVERDLATKFGVSKTPVREALKQLRWSGLVEFNSYQGLRVRSLGATMAEEIYAARLAVEPAAVGQSVAIRGPGVFDTARQALERAQALIDQDHCDFAELGLANRNFHRQLYTVGGNSFLCDFLDQLYDVTTLVATTGWRIKATFMQEADEHRAILQAAEAGDSARVHDLLRAHIEASSQVVSNALGSRRES